MTRLLFFLLLFPICIHSLQVRFPPSSKEGDAPLGQEGAELPSEVTLRQFLKSANFHVGMAPLYYMSKLIHMTVLHVLKENDLPIASLGGGSTAGFVAAAWASKGAYAHVYGTNLSRSDCEPECNKYQKMYLNYLASPTNSEMEALNALTSKEEIEAMGKAMQVGGEKWSPIPSRRQSYIQWIPFLDAIDRFQVKQKFSDLKLPIAVTGTVRDGHAWTDPRHLIAMTKGNLHLAVLTSISEYKITEPIWIHDKYQATDGYYSDLHGVRGYDGLHPTERPASMLNILPLDLPSLPVFMMDFSKLKAHESLKQAATVFLYVWQPMMLQQAHLEKAQAGEKHHTYKDVMLAVREGFTRALDTPLQIDTAHPNMQVSKNLAYYQKVDLAPFYPKLDYFEPMKMESPVGHGATDSLKGADDTIDEVVEVVDKTHLLEDPKLHRLYQRYRKTVKQMYEGEAYVPFKSTRSANGAPPEQMIMDLEEK